MYRHALPPGFVLKKDKKKEEAEEEKISLEELIETEVESVFIRMVHLSLAWTSWEMGQPISLTVGCLC